ncbi:apolipoprotein N-acyltransferase [Mucilaginibacter hurinus]|uniref:Apolipoprotein N-acyltransferase n=1 Tax=Mucilaginibacter hurinus TaxID=2201324 RepID=A0A367GQZ7_9SPHI|nr:apolipoprotein N-acyltransferase [Mucilaginibacter hurinus]RCH55894.1 apolipoprotein N-acyltransferase [Mucilaginibacter hurinus]
MRKLITTNAAKTIISGLITAYAITQVNFILTWVCFVPLFMVLIKQSPKQSATSGLLFGLTISLTCFYWMVPGAVRFTGSSIIYGLLVYIVCSAILSGYFTLLAWCFGRLKKTLVNHTAAVLLNGLLAGCVFVVFESILMLCSSRMPWFEFHSGMALANNLIAIQPAEYFGIHILSFTVISVNYLIAGFILAEHWKKLWIPALVSGLYLLAGFVIMQAYTGPVKAHKVKVAILAQNLPPETKWNDDTGNALVQNMLQLNTTATGMNPDIALWSESAVPWTYRSDDDLVNEILRISKPAGVTHILGINSEGGKSTVYNSVYSLTPSGSIAGRFDKQFLLAFIEQPFAGILFPFLSNAGDEVKPGEGSRTVNTPKGKAGIIVCNEATVSTASYDAVKQGAGFILNLSNDGWFSNSYLVDLHFYHVRLRAVETRRDIVLNSNDGYSGMVNYRGEIIAKRKSTDSFVDSAMITPRRGITVVADKPMLFVYLCAIGIVYFIVSNIVASKQRFTTT